MKYNSAVRKQYIELLFLPPLLSKIFFSHSLKNAGGKAQSGQIQYESFFIISDRPRRRLGPVRHQRRLPGHQPRGAPSLLPPLPRPGGGLRRGLWPSGHWGEGFFFVSVTFLLYIYVSWQKLLRDRLFRNLQSISLLFMPFQARRLRIVFFLCSVLPNEL